MDLETEALRVSNELQTLLQSTLPGNPEITVSSYKANWQITNRDSIIPLLRQGRVIGGFKFSMTLMHDHTRTFSKVKDARYALLITTKSYPLVRLDFEPTRSSPAAHWQIIASSEDIGGVLSDRRRKGTAGMEAAALHLPVGGERFRPGLEDFIEFLAYDLEIDMQPNWKETLYESRANFRLRQLRAAVRDRPEIAAEELLELGWTFNGPTPARKLTTLTHRW